MKSIVTNDVYLVHARQWRERKIRKHTYLTVELLLKIRFHVVFAVKIDENSQNSVDFDEGTK